MHSAWLIIPTQFLFEQFVPSASNNKVWKRMMFSVVVHRSEVCVVEHIPGLYYLDVLNHFQIALPQKNEVNESIPNDKVTCTSKVKYSICLHYVHHTHYHHGHLRIQLLL